MGESRNTVQILPRVELHDTTIPQ